jgi:hypothetical protein
VGQGFGAAQLALSEKKKRATMVMTMASGRVLFIG